MGKELTEQRTQHREMEVWRLRVLQNLSQAEVAERVGLSQQAVSKILSRLQERFAAEFVEQVKAHKEEHTAVLQQVASEALEQWRRSCEDGVSVATVTGRVKATEGGVFELPDQVTRTVAGQCGNAALLAQARGALADIRAIWGAEAPKRAEMSGVDGAPIKLYVTRETDGDWTADV